MNRRRQLALLEQLLDELLAGIQEAFQSGEILSDEFQGAIAAELEATTQEIDRLNAEIAQENDQNGQNQPQTQERNGNIGTLNAQPSADAQLLWMLSGQEEQAFLSYLRSYPTPETEKLLANPSLLSQTLNQLTQMMPQGQPDQIHGIQHADLNSSTIWGTAYDPYSGKMRVRFQGGSEYEYDDVPANIYRAFSQGHASAKTDGQNRYGKWWKNKNPSLGAAMNQYIKNGNFAYRRLK